MGVGRIKNIARGGGGIVGVLCGAVVTLLFELKIFDPKVILISNRSDKQ